MNVNSVACDCEVDEGYNLLYTVDETFLFASLRINTDDEVEHSLTQVSYSFS